ncbi:8-oxo-dGTP diphosphatase [Spinactinospora alkalitolerans]|uniref:8-oxo-dGTP diphosphatase n=1 Tax=Spinactinospora alkalitolerans TaxID=687207 RepID=A0A852TUN6_9ACTN|nr:NUDIX domain-containing protein [Spinactinospora alkalitolerans]NYE46582.1 8-oxo-dGTP diphosphatase [Spinactinospora alkalitolerans]
MDPRQPLNGATVHLGGPPPSYDSVVVLLFAGERPVLVRHRDRAWEFPGGHAEEGEDIVATARREAREEAGAELAEVRVAGYYVLAGGHTTVVTHAQVAGLAPLSGEFETTDVREFDALPPDLSWDDGIYAHLLDVLGLPGAPPILGPA